MKHLNDYRTIHAEDPHYGGGPGAHERAKMLQLAEGFEVQRALDYGCGNSRALELMWPEAERVLYDPALPGKDAEPVGLFDIGLCTDVLEHVPEDELRAMLKFQWELCTRWLFVVHTAPARQVLPSGGNAHVTQRQPGWWRNILNEFWTGQITQWATQNAYRVGFCTWNRP